jgi:transposase-like protein
MGRPRKESAPKRAPQRGKEHDATIRAAVIAALLAGQAVNDVARQFGLDSGLVSRWKARLPEAELQQVAAEKKERLVDLIEGHLSASLKGAARIAAQTNDSEWLAAQSPEKLVLLYTTFSETSFRLMELASKLLSSERAEQPAPRQLP